MDAKPKLGPVNIVFIVLLSLTLALVVTLLMQMLPILLQGPVYDVPPAPVVQADGEPGPAAI